LLLAGLCTAHGAQALRWFDDAGLKAQAHEAVALLAQAPTHGLDEPDYRATALAGALADAASRAQAGTLAPDQAQALDQALTQAMQRYLSHLHRGRVDPRSLHQRFEPPPGEPFDAERVLAEALARGQLASAVAAAVPQLQQYEQLRSALARYRALGAHAAWATPLPPLPPSPKVKFGKLEPGQRWSGVAVLAARLAALGDLDPSAALSDPAQHQGTLHQGAQYQDAQHEDTLYDGVLVPAVRAFQRRHALADDGVIGRATWVQLAVPPAARVRQIELTLERLRWTPVLRAARMVVVNIPEFVLRAYEVEGNRIRMREEMKVIVGRALDMRTPVFEGQLRAIEFSPYWNVPASIAQAELVPQLRRSAARFAAHGYEFVAADGRVQTEFSPAALDDVLAGRLRLRQRPGPANPLGDIKFVFPNTDSIYLHHTPSTALFERGRRDFSHGCIRVEQPVALARFVLQGQPEWTNERIGAAMAAGRSSTLQLDEPVTVLIAYGTVLVRGDIVNFFDDLYGLDRQLDQALRERARPAALS
jgi:murein L,D-transpeptidase YcbB/YkuD